MDAPHIQLFLERLNCEKIKLTSGWVKSACPLASWTHAGGEDKHPSFGIAIDTQRHSGIKCYTCGLRGTMLTLLWRLQAKTSQDLTYLFTFVAEHDHQDEDPLTEKIAKIPTSPIVHKPVDIAGITVSSIMYQTTFGKEKPPEETIFDEAMLGNFKNITPEARDWFTKRGLHPKTVETWELGWHEKGRRIAIPVRDIKGNLVCVSGRAMDSEMSPKFLHSKGFKRDLYLYGEHLCQTPGVGYLVEGFFDAIMLWQRGYRNALCFMGSSLSKFQVEKVLKLCTEVTLIPDGDQAGKEILERCYKALSPRIKTKVTSVPTGLDPDQLDAGYLKQILGPPQAAPLDDPFPVC